MLCYKTLSNYIKYSFHEQVCVDNTGCYEKMLMSRLMCFHHLGESNLNRKQFSRMTID